MLRETVRHELDWKPNLDATVVLPDEEIELKASENPSWNSLTANYVRSSYFVEEDGAGGHKVSLHIKLLTTFLRKTNQRRVST